MMKRILFLAVVVFMMGFQPVITDPVSASWTPLCDAGLDQFANVTFSIKNTGSNPFTDCKVEVFVGPDSTDWDDYDTSWTTCQSLAAGGLATWSISGQSYLRLRVSAQSTAGTTAYCKITANNK